MSYSQNLLHYPLYCVWVSHVASPLKVKKVKCPCALTEHQTIKAYWGSGGIAPRILNLGTRWR